MELETDRHKLINLTNEAAAMQLSVRATAMLVKNKFVTLVSIQDIRNELDEKGNGIMDQANSGANS